ncbi:hypothetical protein BH23CHL4_BH23CHL4_25100 [soil metagenome]
MEEALARGVQIFLALSIAYFVALWFALAVWAYKDIGARSQSVVTQMMATLMVVVFSVPGALLYMLLRPKDTLDDAYQRSLEEEYLLQDLEELPVCQSCQRPVQDEFILCPHCQTTLKEGCPACARLISVKWSICPYCGSDQSDRSSIIREQLPSPQERYIERGAGTFKPLPSSTIRPAASMAPVAEEAFIGPAFERPGIESGPSPFEAEEEEAAESGEPIRLFDRKKTRLLRASEQSDDSHALNGASNTGLNGKPTEADDADEENQLDDSLTGPLARNGAANDHPGDEADAETNAEAASDRA